MKILVFSIALSLMAASCSNGGSYKKPENAIDAGREFVRAALDGDHDKAFRYLLKDSTNELLFAQQETNYQRLTAQEKSNYKESSIRPVEIKPENDSVTIFRYYHSANNKDTFPLRIVKHNGEWLVDLKSIIKM